MEIPEIVVIKSKPFQDARGQLWENHKQSTFSKNGISDLFVQDNCSHSIRGVLRGLHYQKAPAAQAKLVSTISGEIFDVAVDMRKGSPNFGHWVGVRLGSGDMLYIPTGFAHGYCVLSPEATVLYKVTVEYTPALDRGIHWNDSTLGIDWPIKSPLLSAKDQQLPTLVNADNNFVYSP